ncbi:MULTISPECIES: TolC family protein [Tenacibaculum]|uniref:TolC family protein n=1 Tax=Tenacibaculum TaxID=104267 RepID=UPI0021AF99CE|nr:MULTISPECIES: TolC family protein [Tenacibaculum]MCT4699328.1 TolC family protein [Tenacibaculum haliotis]WBX71556.1 TolC family protein [Tenacibaculum retecalamus]
MKKYIYSVFIFFCTSFLFAQEELNISMQEAIDYAIKNNYENKIALNNIEAAKERKWETTTMGLPQINGKVDYQNWLKQQVSLLPAEISGGAPGTFTPVNFGTKQTMDASLTLKQLIFDGSYLVGLQSAKTYLKISEQAKEKTELATREAVINSYGNVLVIERTIDILENNRTALQKNLDETQKIYENGLTELENVEQLQITLGTIENNYSNAKRMKSIAYKMLNIALGNSIEKKIVVTDNLDDLVLANTDLSLLAKVFNVDDHIDFKIAENETESKKLLMKLEQSKALPTLSAFVNYGASANSNDFDFLKGSQEWFDYSLLGVSLNVPIFSSFGRRSKTARARIELENAEIQSKNIEQKLKLQAETAKSDYQLSIESFQTAKKNLGLAERIEKKQQIKFFEGLSSSFDLLQAQNQLYTQQNNYVQSMLNVIAVKAQLENALNIPLK